MNSRRRRPRVISLEAEAALDGLYAIRSNVSSQTLSDHKLVRSYKLLSRAERACRTMKSVDLQVRPVHHRLADRVRAHITLTRNTVRLPNRAGT